MKNWQNILEAFCAAPAIFLEEITKGWQDFWQQEHELAANGEYIEESMDQEE